MVIIIACQQNVCMSINWNLIWTSINVSMCSSQEPIHFGFEDRNAEEDLIYLVCMNVYVWQTVCKKGFNLIQKQSKWFYWNEVVTLSKCNVLMISYFIFVLKEKLQLFLLNIYFSFWSVFFFSFPKCQSFIFPHALDFHKSLIWNSRNHNTEALVIVCYCQHHGFSNRSKLSLVVGQC